MSEPDEDDLGTLDADLRHALQQQHAEYERMRELEREVEELLARANELLQRTKE